MAKENDEVQQNGSGSGNNSNSGDAIATVGVTLSAQNNAMSALATVTAATVAGEVDGLGDAAGLADGKDKVIDGGCDGDIGGGEGVCESTTSYGREKLNDLVADLCINNGLPRCAVAPATTAGTAGTGSGSGSGGGSGNGGGVSGNGGYGDYTNIRATSGPSVYVEGTPNVFGKAAEQTWEGSSVTQAQSSYVQAPTQNSSFSFKHFLNSGNTLTAPTSTVTSLDPAATSCSTHNNSNSNTSATPTSSASASNPLQTSTGARPKVPQSASLSATSIASLGGGGLSAGGGGQEGSAFGSSATKMKRSPRFSSFDSQASLAEYAAVGADSDLECGGGGVRASCGGSSTGFRLFPEALGGETCDLFNTRVSSNLGGNSSAANANNVGASTERQYVPRSYSNYDMPMPATGSPRRRGGVSNAGNSSSSSGAKEARPTRLALNTTSSKLKLDLPIDDVSNATASASAVNSNVATRPTSNNPGEFPPAAAAAALPDFVQDHWMDSWYAHEMHLNSPPNSPIRGFADEAIGTAATGMGSGASVGAGDGALPAYNSNAAAGAGVVGGVGAGSAATEPSGNSKMLPDFLSDGPIIHSSQRLADVAVGLPSNSIGSPDDPPMSSQLSRLRIENERLQRELNDARAALGDQTRRTNELERQLQERQRSDSSYSRNLSQKISVSEESLDKSKMRTAAAQSHVVKLKQQVIQLTAEVETLRRENDVLREEGAVGGYSAPSCERARTFATEAAGGVRANVSRPSRTQQISKDLRRAASNAENNLRQLLAGVDNLRQMAADIENSELRQDYDVSPDLFSDFLDDCDDYEEYPGGPAL